jgi:hypothetical protein
MPNTWTEMPTWMVASLAILTLIIAGLLLRRLADRLEFARIWSFELRFNRRRSRRPRRPAPGRCTSKGYERARQV